MKCQHGIMSEHNMEIDWKHQTWVSFRDSDHCWNLPTGPEAIKTRSKRVKLCSFGMDWSWLNTFPDCMTLWIETIEAYPRLCLFPTNAHGFEPFTRFWSDGWTSISNSFFDVRGTRVIRVSVSWQREVFRRQRRFGSRPMGLSSCLWTLKDDAGRRSWRSAVMVPEVVVSFFFPKYFIHIYIIYILYILYIYIYIIYIIYYIYIIYNIYIYI